MTILLYSILLQLYSILLNTSDFQNIIPIFSCVCLHMQNSSSSRQNQPSPQVQVTYMKIRKHIHRNSEKRVTAFSKDIGTCLDTHFTGLQPGQEGGRLPGQEDV